MRTAPPRRGPAAGQSSRPTAMMPRSARTTAASGSAPAGRGVEGVGEDRVGPLEIALQQVGDGPRCAAWSLGRAQRAEPVPGTCARHAASPRRRRGTAARADTPGSSPSCCRRAADPLRRPARRPPPTFGLGWPAEQREDQARRARRPPGSARSAARCSNHSIQRRTVSTRPLAQTGCITSSTSRATRSASPACLAWSMASSARPLASHHAAARGGARHELRFTPPQLGAQQVTEQVVVAVPLAPPVQRDQQQVGPLQRLQHRGRPGGAQRSRRTAARTSARAPRYGSGTTPRPADSRDSSSDLR